MPRSLFPQPNPPRLQPAPSVSLYTIPLPIYTPCFLCDVHPPSSHLLKSLSQATVVLKEDQETCVALAKPVNLFGIQFSQL